MVIDVEDSHIEWKILKVIEDKHVDDLLALNRALNEFARAMADPDQNDEEDFKRYKRIVFMAACTLRNVLKDDGLLDSFAEFCEVVKSTY